MQDHHQQKIPTPSIDIHAPSTVFTKNLSSSDFEVFIIFVFLCFSAQAGVGAAWDHYNTTKIILPSFMFILVLRLQIYIWY